MVKSSYNEILEMVVNACRRNFPDDIEDKENTIIECATKIYIKQMEVNQNG